MLKSVFRFGIIRKQAVQYGLLRFYGMCHSFVPGLELRTQQLGCCMRINLTHEPASCREREMAIAENLARFRNLK
jgi:hypothetical protein